MANTLNICYDAVLRIMQAVMNSKAYGIDLVIMNKLTFRKIMYEYLSGKVDN